MTIALSPECRDPFKHGSCVGNGWDPETEQVAPCPCPCHEKETES